MKVMLDSGAFAPTRAHKNDAGLALRSPLRIEVSVNGAAVFDSRADVELSSGTIAVWK